MLPCLLACVRLRFFTFIQLGERVLHRNGDTHRGLGLLTSIKTIPYRNAHRPGQSRQSLIETIFQGAKLQLKVTITARHCAILLSSLQLGG